MAAVVRSATAQQIKYCKALPATFADCFIEEKDDKVNVLTFFDTNPCFFNMNL